MHIQNLSSTTIWGDYDVNASNNYHQVPVPSMGLGSIRLWDSNGCSWRNIERTQGVYSWERLDNAVNLAIANNLDIIFTLGCGPDWATVSPGIFAGLYVGYNPHKPINNTVWNNWCAAVATRYLGKIKYYEIWNEVNDKDSAVVGSGFTGTVADIVNLTQQASQTIKAIDPTVKILSPNFVGELGIVNPLSTEVTLERFLELDGDDYCDIISIHGYNSMPTWTRPEGMIGYGNLCKTTLARFNVTKPLWNTEWGWGQWRDATGSFHPRPGSLGFNPVINAAPSTVQTSNTITVTQSYSVSISGGTYSKNGGAYTSSSGSVVNGDTLTVRHTSDANPSTKVVTTLILNTTSTVFSSTTAAAGVTPSPTTIPPNNQMPDDISTSYTTRMVLLSWCVGFERLYVYALDGVQSYSSIVMVNPTSDVAAATLLPPAYAYKYCSDLLTGGRLSDFQATTDASSKLYWRANFKTAAGRSGVVVWCDDYDTATISTPNLVEVTDNLGNALTVNTTTTVTGSPKFLFYS
jgi:hypothetical protein